MDTTKKKAIIIGAGPAGLTAAYELLKRSGIIPIIFEKSKDIGGISKTINYKGNRMDIGGHRFFSKSDRVMDWWMNILPVQETAGATFTINYQNKSREVDARTSTPHKVAKVNDDKVMLIRKRLSRIYFLRQFFTYPITLSIETLWKLGIGRTIAILFSYLKAQLFPRKPENSLEDFMINRFGQTLYHLFFKDYTEKVWGVPCNEIPAEWGAQRIKGVSIRKALQHAIQEATKRKNRHSGDIAQKDTETSLIEQFLYPKYGPGQLWEEVARQVEEMGGIIYMEHDVRRVHVKDGKVIGITILDHHTGMEDYIEGDYFFSTMPVRELIAGIEGTVPEHVSTIAAGLQYRDFITVGILLRRLSYEDKDTGEWKPLTLEDTWIYIQEKEVTVGRLQIFNNWSPYLVNDPNTIWVGMEFFCNETDAFWNLPDDKIKELAIEELQKIGLAAEANVLDNTVLRVEKTYPAYFGAYAQFDQVREYTDSLENLFLVGRNGMHKYINADHSMLTAMLAVDNIIAGVTAKDNIWAINTEQEYHEEKKTAPEAPEAVVGNPPAAQLAIPTSFNDYLFRWKPNSILLWMAGLAILLQFIVFKIMYPYAGFIDGDSYVYLESAYLNLNINTYPIGYSKFLRIFSTFTHSDTALVCFQYLLLQGSALYLFFTIRYFFQPGKLVNALLFIFLIGNPVWLYLGNYISSDALFISLSLYWFTSLLWIIQRPNRNLIVLHTLLLLLAFTVRYNALFYPFISTLAFIISRQSLKMKLIGIVASFLVIAGFIYHTGNQYGRLTGIRQFSPFSGWQMANNALYAYRYVKDKSSKPLPERFKALDEMVRNYFNVDAKSNPWEQVQANTWYMWDARSPLRKYMREQFKNDTSTNNLKRWATVAPLYADYGEYLIKQYPKEFVTYFIAPNAIKYYVPPVEFLDSYNGGVDSVAPIAQMWFGYNSLKVRTIFKDLKVKALDFFPVTAAILNVVFVLGVIGFIVLGGTKRNPLLAIGILLVAGLWFINFSFSIFAAAIALRFQLFPIVIYSTFSLLLLEYLVKSANAK
ncbi:NAD(P)/FAD-dependent oxidoreductase [Chitinophaga sancti]|uniref:NAD(P)/FAD-dependent oxidoreductase n=1 Tax=Chitinophaga sancti TaxID=1004 RepID=UPI002A75BEC5|nr:NAD(P)/FAD-dependent oxidoreductase [Chitinophaga sancti]WPQ63326.1 NAD(P)/FAD-dependent oxidoreductase [Chitinophaga sancti]